MLYIVLRVVSVHGNDECGEKARVAPAIFGLHADFVPTVRRLRDGMA
jgi:hypothetical protein